MRLLERRIVVVLAFKVFLRCLAFLAKLGWRLINEKDSLWARVISGKYMSNSFQPKHIVYKQGASNAWQGIVKAEEVLIKGVGHLVRSGKDTKFWLDVWIHDYPLVELTSLDISLIDFHRTVSDY